MRSNSNFHVTGNTQSRCSASVGTFFSLNNCGGRVSKGRSSSYLQTIPSFMLGLPTVFTATFVKAGYAAVLFKNPQGRGMKWLLSAALTNLRGPTWLASYDTRLLKQRN